MGKEFGIRAFQVPLAGFRHILSRPCSNFSPRRYLECKFAKNAASSRVVRRGGRGGRRTRAGMHARELKPARSHRLSHAVSATRRVKEVIGAHSCTCKRVSRAHMRNWRAIPGNRPFHDPRKAKILRRVSVAITFPPRV